MALKLFKDFPQELFNMYQLEAIKLRSNPIKFLPDKLSCLKNLKILQFSFCQLKFLPEWYFIKKKRLFKTKKFVKGFKIRFNESQLISFKLQTFLIRLN
jgi:hypothetical protein